MTFLPGWDSFESVNKLYKLFSILGFVSLGLMVVFEILGFVYSNRKDVLVAHSQNATAKERQQQEENENRKHDAQIQEANQQAAEAKNHADQAEKMLRETKEPRTLAMTERVRISSFLSKQPKGTIIIQADMNAFDARPYATEISELLKSAGWSVRLDNVMIIPTSNNKPTGMWITIKDPKLASPAAGHLQQAFEAAGILVRGEVDPTLPNADEVRLTIGSK